MLRLLLCFRRSRGPGPHATVLTRRWTLGSLLITPVTRRPLRPKTALTYRPALVQTSSDSQLSFHGRWIFGTGCLSVVLPYTFADVNSSSVQARTNGVSDIGFLWQMNIFGGPALTREQFQSFVPQTFSSFHLYVGTPLGTYNATSPINPSANR